MRLVIFVLYCAAAYFTYTLLRDYNKQRPKR